MKLKTVKLITRLLIAAIVVLLGALLLTGQKVWGYAAIAVCIGTGLLKSGLYKCPECGKFLGSFSNKRCPDCGAEIDLNRKAE